MNQTVIGSYIMCKRKAGDYETQISIKEGQLDSA